MKVKTRLTKVKVRDLTLEYEELFALNEQGKEVFDRGIWIQNDIQLYNLYKQEKGLLTTDEVIAIRNGHNLSHKAFADLLGLSEKEIVNIENGAIQTPEIDRAIRVFDG